MLSPHLKALLLSGCALLALVICFATNDATYARSVRVPNQQASPLSPLNASEPPNPTSVAPQGSVASTQFPIFVGREANQTSLLLVGAIFMVLLFVVGQAIYRRQS